MRGIIYCIKQKEKGYDSPIYIGSTKHFDKRYNDHKSNCNNPKSKYGNIKLYQYIRENGEWDNFEMLEIGVIEYESYEELRKQEQMWIDDLGATLNDVRAYRSIEYTKEYNRQYMTGYKDIKNKKRNEKIVCECGVIVSKCNLKRHLKGRNHTTMV